MTHRFPGLLLLLVAGLAGASEVDWPGFMTRHRMAWDSMPKSWTQAPHFGNGLIGSMLYEGGGALRLQVFHAGVHDHRDNTHGWTAYSRAKYNIGDFHLKPVGRITGCEFTKNIWDAELTGTVMTDAGTIGIRHFVHHEDMVIVTEVVPSGGEAGCEWSRKPVKAVTTRPGYPTDEKSLEKFARTYGDHYRETLQPFTPNPPGRLEKQGAVSCWIQDLLAGGQYATAWTEKSEGTKRTLFVSIANSHPEKSAAQTSVKAVKHARDADMPRWIDAHRRWWHDYYRQSYVSLPDPVLESLYWQTIYRLACTARPGSTYIDTSGMWFQGGSWPYTTNDHNTQVAHWPLYAANRLQLSQPLVDALHENRQALIDSVEPAAWREDSAFLHVTTARDLYGPRNQDRRYYNLVGCLPWTMHNCWLQYRYSMDDEMLRGKIYPLLRRSINMYRHMLHEEDGKLRLKPTYSPETGTFKDCHFDLGLLKWGCKTLLAAADRLRIDDPLIPVWKDILARSVDYPVDEFGFRLGADKTSPTNHRHGSHFIAAYPLRTVNIEQEGTKELLAATLERFKKAPGYPAMRVAYSGPLAASLGYGDLALEELKDLAGDLHPNGLWFSSPCLEVSLSVANVVQEMLIQSWGDKIRVFPAMPEAWSDAEFHDLRTEGAFLVSAKRAGGETHWIRVKSLAGEPCRMKPGFEPVPSDLVKPLDGGVYEIRIPKGGEITLINAASGNPPAKETAR